jgi:hypothetical protein
MRAREFGRLAEALCERLLGVEAAGKSLESISKPLQRAD